MPDDATAEELEHARSPEPPRESFYADVLAGWARRRGRRWPEGNAMRFLEGVLR